MKIDRRTFLQAALAGAALGAVNQRSAVNRDNENDPDRYDFLLTRVKFICSMSVRDHWNAFPGGDRNLLEQFSSVIRCKVKPLKGCNDNLPHDGSDSQFNAVVDLTDAEELRQYPFLFMTASGSYALSKEKKENLRQYLNEGGFLYMDDCVAGISDDGDYFYRSSYRTLEEIFGRGAVKDVSTDHEIFHNVYDMGDIGLPYCVGQFHGPKGIFIGDRLAVFLTSTDVHCGWVDRTGAWFGNGGKMGIGKHGHREAIKMGINIVMYAVSH